MNIAVCIKSVPDPDQYDKIELDPVKKTLKREGIPAIINNGDKHAIEEALRLKEKFGGDITAISMGIPSAKHQMMEALAMGCDRAYLISDRRVGGADSLATSYTLAKAIEKTGPYDLILAGNESADGATSHVPSQLGEWLGVGHGVDATSLEVEDDEHVLITKKFENGSAKYRLGLPCVIGCNARINEVRLTSAIAILKAKKKPFKLLTADDLENLDAKYIGLKGSPSKNGELHPVASNKVCTMIEGESEAEVIDKLYAVITNEMNA